MNLEFFARLSEIVSEIFFFYFVLFMFDLKQKYLEERLKV